MIRRPHQHPFLGQCQHCGAASDLEQVLVGLVALLIVFVLPMAYFMTKFVGAAVEVVK